MSRNGKSVLIVEDNEDEVFLLRHAARQAGIDEAQMLMLPGGQEAVDYLCDVVATPSVPPSLPRLMLLDLAMPGLNGFAVLEWLRRQPLLQRMPVVVLTCSSLPEDQSRAQKLGATEFKTKPVNQQAFIALMTELRERYLS